jgi:hypothetical protein
MRVDHRFEILVSEADEYRLDDSVRVGQKHGWDC